MRLPWVLSKIGEAERWVGIIKIYLRLALNCSIFKNIHISISPLIILSSLSKWCKKYIARTLLISKYVHVYLIHSWWDHLVSYWTVCRAEYCGKCSREQKCTPLYAHFCSICYRIWGYKEVWSLLLRSCFCSVTAVRAKEVNSCFVAGFTAHAMVGHHSWREWVKLVSYW